MGGRREEGGGGRRDEGGGRREEGGGRREEGGGRREEGGGRREEGGGRMGLFNYSEEEEGRGGQVGLQLMVRRQGSMVWETEGEEEYQSHTACEIDMFLIFIFVKYALITFINIK